ncbi:MAG: ACP S-malonyltransferase [Aeromicrobium sp.]|nr:ACP S-malonyltransferase [Aeromicrobium sp.]
MTGRVAFVFPGQGSQRVGMLDALPASDRLEQLLAFASECAGLPLQQIAADGPDATLADTRAAQPLLLLSGWAWGRALLESGVTPAAVAGHSLGEITALAFAGVLDITDALRLVCVRSRLMAEAAERVPGTMAAVIGMDAATIHDAVSGLSGVWVANDNAPGQIVLSGTHAGIESATRALSAAGARKIVPLAVAGPFHSPLMASAAEAFAEVLDRTGFLDAAVPVYQNTTAAPASDAAALKAHLAAQITSPVRWTETMTAFVVDGIGTLVESGPGAVLTGLARRMDGLEAFSAESAGIDRIREVVAS